MQSGGSYFERDAFANMLGVTLVQNQTDEVVVEMELDDAHMNGLGGVHGGVIFSLADIAFATACNQFHTAIGIQADIRYLNKAVGVKLIARARNISKSNKLSNFEILVTDEEQTKIACFTGLAYHLVRN
ncbi:PaaI family thioesterase [Alteromonas macleodii]|uniref:PaaI family thioesterase n=1 Tax=Alteromonas TaxID=226 RepID=UPI0010376030|nr:MULTISPECIES: PaaI family thioesterase [Alteromonas]TAP29828.1 PaaI family thioesterase [Alteromonas sp. KUL17]USI27211.1 PaaI family thioesterase [Alteromonas macleodii]GEA02229.1 phenylacetic acid degradation protein [Alteromonas sp. KUL17]